MSPGLCASVRAVAPSSVSGIAKRSRTSTGAVWWLSPRQRRCISERGVFGDESKPPERTNDQAERAHGKQRDTATTDAMDLPGQENRAVKQPDTGRPGDVGEMRMEHVAD